MVAVKTGKRARGSWQKSQNHSSSSLSFRQATTLDVIRDRPVSTQQVGGPPSLHNMMLNDPKVSCKTVVFSTKFGNRFMTVNCLLGFRLPALFGRSKLFALPRNSLVFYNFIFLCHVIFCCFIFSFLTLRMKKMKL